MFDLGHIVLNATTGKKGLVVPDMMGCCAEYEVPVLYEGSPGFCGTNKEELEDLGPENPIPDFNKCGGGKGAECCIFLTAGANGFGCERSSELRNALIFRTMSSKRNPTALFPKCQLNGKAS
jgi:hypothetical protein